MVFMPDLPSIMEFQNFSTPHPKGLTIPAPVTTTRLLFIILLKSKFFNGNFLKRLQNKTFAVFLKLF